MRCADNAAAFVGRYGEMSGSTRLKTTALVLCVSLVAAAGLSLRAAAAQQDGQEAKKFDVKATFRNICGFCHEDYGRKAGKGPQLMSSPSTDQQLFNMIKHGKPGRMAAFGGVFTDEQVWQIVKFIRQLEPGESP